MPPGSRGRMPTYKYQLNTMKKIILAWLGLCSMAVAHAGMSNSIEYSQVYIVGGAVSSGWDLATAPELSKISDGVFQWDGELKGGEDFKFMNTREAWHKHIVATEANQTMETGVAYPLDFYANWQLTSDRDCKFKVAETGNYRVTVDLVGMMVNVTPQPEASEFPDKFYATGSALDGQVVELTDFYSVEFKQVLSCKVGNIVLMNTPQVEDNTTYYVPQFEDVDLTFGKGFKSVLRPTTDASARGWSVSVPGDYTVYVAKGDHSYQGKLFKPRTELYIVGGCCELSWNYWDESNNRFLPNPDNAEELVWEGELRIGWKDENVEPDLFKILTAKSWFEETYHPYVAGQEVVGTSSFRTSGGDDNKWSISKNGLYRITVNTKHETITAELLQESSAAVGAGDKLGMSGISDCNQAADVEVRAVGRDVCVMSSPEPVDVEVYNLAGMKVAESKDIANGVVAKNLSEGIYLLTINGATVHQNRKVKI